jgi:hypothetical protein
MKERGILFSGPLVRAILDGRKTETRRAICPRRPGDYHTTMSDGSHLIEIDLRAYRDLLLARPVSFRGRCPYGKVGDRLWVRETWALRHNEDAHPVNANGQPCTNKKAVRLYRATGDDVGDGRWVPSIHMPHWASRIDLKVTGVRVERLQDIDEDGAMTEGLAPLIDPDGLCEESAREGFAATWDGIYKGKPGLDWTSNPWVWVVQFERVKRGRE